MTHDAHTGTRVVSGDRVRLRTHWSQIGANIALAASPYNPSTRPHLLCTRANLLICVIPVGDHHDQRTNGRFTLSTPHSTLHSRFPPPSTLLATSLHPPTPFGPPKGAGLSHNRPPHFREEARGGGPRPTPSSTPNHKSIIDACARARVHVSSCLPLDTIVPDRWTRRDDEAGSNTDCQELNTPPQGQPHVSHSSISITVVAGTRNCSVWSEVQPQS